MDFHCDLCQDIGEKRLVKKSWEEIQAWASKFYPQDRVSDCIAIFQEQVALGGEFWNDPPIIYDPTAAKHAWYPGPSEGSHTWHYFVSTLQKSGLSEPVIQSVDASTTNILGLGSSPYWPKIDTRGLVMGYVQSGKTTNFLGVAAKAFDIGFRLVIILSGTTNNLRDQTQKRMEKALKKQDTPKWYLLTSENADFKPSVGNALSLTQSDLKLIAVVKKNAPRLRNLYNWLESAGSGARQGLSVLVIDDECDQATINSGSKQRRTAINTWLGKLLHPDFLPKSEYIGYSATPFANLLADPKVPENLYPKNFIVSLDKSDGYFGPEQLFGREPIDADDEATSGADIIRYIPLEEIPKVSPPRKRADQESWEPKMTPELEESILWFLVASGVRAARGQEENWSTMMIHTSSNVDPQFKMQTLVKSYLTLSSSEQKEEILDSMERVWEQERYRFTYPGRHVESWEEIKEFATRALQNATVIVDNYRSPDRLNYGDDEVRRPIIVVGGNTLSRGLTLEGLVSTFFVRSASAYDSMLQMGRWFGYRPGYEDLQRIWLCDDHPYETAKWFRKLSMVELEIRNQIELYAREGLDPMSLAIKIRKIPGMAITQESKMRDAIDANISFAQSRQQTILFESSKIKREKNIAAVSSLVEELKAARNLVDTADGWKIARDVDSKRILDFLSQYEFHADSRLLNFANVNKYVTGLNELGELTKWNIVFYSNARKHAKEAEIGPSVTVKMANRSKVRGDENINIKALISLGDMVADKPEIKATLSSTGKLTEARMHLARMQDSELQGKGLLGIYLIDGQSVASSANSTERENLDLDTNLVGLYTVFPSSEQAFSFPYKTANIAAMEEAVEEFDDQEDQAEATDERELEDND